MIKEAIFSDETAEYASLISSGECRQIRLRLRTGRDDNLRAEYVKRGEEPRRMLRVSSDAHFDYYEFTETLTDEVLSYCFIISEGETRIFYDKLGASEGHNDDYNFCIIPDFTTPEWAHGAIIYQIFPDRFCNGDMVNDTLSGEYDYYREPVHHIDNWYDKPEERDFANFYGGDIAGIIMKLDYLKSLSIDAIYLNPVFESPSNHKYDTTDYYNVDAHFGGNEKLIELIEKAHKLGIKIILDGVFNHCGNQNEWLKTHPEYFKRQDDGTYECWWGVETLPKLNYDECPELTDVICDVAKRYLLPPFNADGWRLDVAADLGHSEEFNHRFWQHFRRAVKSCGEDKVIIAEHYGSAKNWLNGHEWDSVMNYEAFMDPVDDLMVGVDKHSDVAYSQYVGDGEYFMQKILKTKSDMPPQSYMMAMNELDNHDHSRFLTRTNHRTGRLFSAGSDAAELGTNLAVLRQAAVLQFTWQGAPTIYYGDEAGVAGWTDPDNRRPYPWGRENKELIEFYRRLAAVHQASPALKTGSLVPLVSVQNIVAYARTLGALVAITVINTSDDVKAVDVPVWLAGVSEGAVLTRVLSTDQYGYDGTEAGYTICGDALYLEMLPHSAAIFIK